MFVTFVEKLVHQKAISRYALLDITDIFYLHFLFGPFKNVPVVVLVYRAQGCPRKKNYRRGEGKKILVGVVSRIQFFVRGVVKVVN